MADEATVRGWIADAVAAVCPDGPDKSKMGQVMGKLMAAHKGEFDGKDASKWVGEALSGAAPAPKPAEKEAPAEEPKAEEAAPAEEPKAEKAAPSDGSAVNSVLEQLKGMTAADTRALSTQIQEAFGSDD